MCRLWLIPLCAALVVLPACRRAPEHARVDAALAPLMPDDTCALACLRLDRLKDTPFYARYVAGRRIKALEDFSQRTGLDVRENVWELVFTTNGRTSYVFIRGKFGGDFGFEPDLRRPDLHRTSYKDHAKHYAQATPNIFGILKNGHSPCKNGLSRRMSTCKATCSSSRKRNTSRPST